MQLCEFFAACATPTSAQPPVTEATEADSPTKIGTPNNNGGEVKKKISKDRYF